MGRLHRSPARPGYPDRVQDRVHRSSHIGPENGENVLGVVTPTASAGRVS